MRLSGRFIATIASCALAGAGLAACGDDEDPGAGGGASGELSGTISIDGSSTVAPLSEAAAELFQQQNPGVRVSVGTSGTGGGFDKFCRGETDVAGASRPIKEEEIANCEKAGIRYEQLGVANDGISVVVHPDNDWAECLTVEELGKIWDRGSTLDNWSQVRAGFPDQKMELYGPGTDSGTFDYFTEAINGEEGRQRTQYNNIGEDDNAVITGVAGDKGASGYVPLSFVTENEGKLNAIEIGNEDGDCVAPSEQTVQDGSYNPLGRQLFLYPSDRALARPEVKAFLEFYIERNDEITERARFIALTDEQKQEAEKKVARLAGTGTATPKAPAATGTNTETAPAG